MEPSCQGNHSRSLHGLLLFTLSRVLGNRLPPRVTWACRAARLTLKYLGSRSVQPISQTIKVLERLY